MNTTEEIKKYSSYTMLVLDIVSIAILTMSVIFNLLGIYLLKQLQSPRLINQIFLLISMSTSELLLALFSVINKVGKFTEVKQKNSSIFVYHNQISAALLFICYTTFFLLTFDRFLTFMLHLKYHKIVTRKRTFYGLLVTWLSGVAIAVPFLFLSANTFLVVWHQYIYFIFDGIILVTAFVTYSYIVNKALGKHRTASSRVPRREKMFVVVTIIILTFVLLVIIPDIAYMHLFVVNKVGSDIDESIIWIIWELNYLVDPCVYIFLQRNIRKILQQKICKFTISSIPDSVIYYISHFSGHAQHEIKGHRNSKSYDTKM